VLRRTLPLEEDNAESLDLIRKFHQKKYLSSLICMFGWEEVKVVSVHRAIPANFKLSTRLRTGKKRYML